MLIAHAIGGFLSPAAERRKVSGAFYFTVLGCVYAFTYFVEAREGEARASRLAAQLNLRTVTSVAAAPARADSPKPDRESARPR